METDIKIRMKKALAIQFSVFGVGLISVFIILIFLSLVEPTIGLLWVLLPGLLFFLVAKVLHPTEKEEN